MELTISKRSAETKSVNSKIRVEGNIPAILYSGGKPGETIVVNGQEFAALLRHIKPGCLSTTILELQGDFKGQRAIIKDIQYNITSYRVIHLDLNIIEDKTPLTLNVPIHCTGVADCAGIKLGGVLRPVIRRLKVHCLPKDIPTEFLLDIADLNMGGKKRLSDLTMPAGVQPITTKLDEVAIVIAKR